ncbi:MAG: tyrosine-type recombinase/integrase [Vulcanimicrobiaceae bacterium]
MNARVDTLTDEARRRADYQREYYIRNRDRIRERVRRKRQIERERRALEPKAPPLRAYFPKRPPPPGKRHVTPAEFQALLDAIPRRVERFGPEGWAKARDRVALLLMYRHGLRRLELSWLNWGDIDLKRAEIHIHRAKGSRSGTHPLFTAELRALGRLQKLDPMSSNARAPLIRARPWKATRATYSTVTYPLMMLSRVAGLPYDVHAHMLRHGCGYYLCNVARADLRVAQAWLGHVQIQHTVKYTELDPGRFDRLWTD